MTTAISVRNLTQRYGTVTAVDDVDLDLAVGETLAVIGPNGAGKSSLFGAVAGERAITSGKISLFGTDVSGWEARKLARHGLSRTFQVARFFETMTPAENVEVACGAIQRDHRRFIRRMSACVDRDAVAGALEAVGLDHGDQRLAGTLSQGDRKRLELAMALAQNPKILLLDEPTAGMGAEDIPPTIALLQSLIGPESGISCLITAHDMEVVFAIADRVVLMASGQVVVSGTPDEVRTDSRTREIYLGESNE